ncbi:MAG TPA: hypothetical protein QF555_04280 [Candidatus Thalassarchaeaceae archaeon]|nr:hypothetical protein [Candidatus Thalassarchaeaceae archaeon]
MDGDESPPEPSVPTLSSIPEEEPVFASTGATLMLPSQMPRDPRMHLALMFILLAGVLGSINGYDFIEGDGGLVTDRGFIYSQTQTANLLTTSSPGSAILTGVLTLHDGSPGVNFSIEVVTPVDEDGVEKITRPNAMTDSKGRFRLEGLNPGLMTMFVVNMSNPNEGMTHRILLSPGALFEPYGFTHLDLDFAAPEEFDLIEQKSNGITRWMDLREEERGKELYDPTAAAVYDIAGTIFIGISGIAIVFAIAGWRSKSTLLLRTAAGLVFFSQGHYYSSCCLGLIALLTTFGLHVEDV